MGCGCRKGTTANKRRTIVRKRTSPSPRPKSYNVIRNRRITCHKCKFATSSSKYLVRKCTKTNRSIASIMRDTKFPCPISKF